MDQLMLLTLWRTLLMEQKNEKIEVVYKKAKLGKRFLAYFIDIGLFLLSSFIFLSISNTVFTKTPLYTSRMDELTQIKNDSALYVDGTDLITYVDNLKNPDQSAYSYAQRKEIISDHINQFYSNPTYFSDTTSINEQYKARKLNTNLFEPDGSEKSGAPAESLYNFYKSEFQDHSLAYLVNNQRYFYLTRFAFLSIVIQFVIISTIVFAVFFLVLPLTCFKRGRQTIGMKLENIGLITIDAENQSTGKYLLRVLFNYGVFYLLNFVSFLIPSFVSISMVFITKTNSSLTNYVFNDYCVDVTDKKIYFNALEREEAQLQMKKMSIENRDLHLK